MLTRKVRQRLASLMMAYATYLVYVCPCKRILSCHKMSFFLSAGGAATLIAHEYMPKV